MDWVLNAINNLLRYAEHMGRPQWLLVLAGAILIGALCLRGFGSRAQY